MLVRNYMLIPGSKNFAVASEQKFLIGDGLLTKAWQIMDFLTSIRYGQTEACVNPGWRVSGYATDEFGKQTERGYLSSIGITLKNDPERIRVPVVSSCYGSEGGKSQSSRCVAY